MQCRALIVDLFGVVLAFDEASVYRRFANNCSSPAIALKSMQGLVSTPALIEGKLSLEQVHERLVAEQGLALSYEVFREGWLALYTSSMPGVAEILTELSVSYRLILLSNVDRYYLEVVRSSYRELDLFAAQLVSCKLGYAKPSAQAFNAALQVAQAKPSECYFIDDKMENVAAAREIGIRGHVFVDAKTLRKALSEARILPIVPSAA